MFARLSGAAGLAILLELVVTITSRLYPAIGGSYGAPFPLGRASPLRHISFREGLVTFDPWFAAANVVVTTILILPAMPFSRIPRAVAAGLGASGIVYLLWVALLDPGAPERALLPVEHGGILHPLALWLILMLATLGAIAWWRRRTETSVIWTFGSPFARRIVVALASAVLIQVLVTGTSVMFPARASAGQRIYGAPLPVGDTPGLTFLPSGPGTFDSHFFLANIVLTAAVLLLAVPKTRTWSTGVIGILASIGGYLTYLVPIVLAFAGVNVGFAGLPLPTTNEFGALPWFLWANLIIWHVVGMALWRWRSSVRRPKPSLEAQPP